MRRHTSLQTQNDFMAKYIDEVKAALDKLDLAQVEKVIVLLIKAYTKGNKVFILGDGGAASTASHMACDLGKGTISNVYDRKEKRLKVISLTDNVAVLTAYANDLSFEEVFVQQLRNLVEKDDLVIALSCSGNSPNVINAVRYAKSVGALTIGLSGFKKGGQLARLTDCSIVVQSNQYGPIEDMHLVLNHIITSCFFRVKNGKNSNKVNKSTPFENE